MRPCSKALALPGLGVVTLTSQTLSGLPCAHPRDAISMAAAAKMQFFKRIALFSCPDMGAYESGPNRCTDGCNEKCKRSSTALEADLRRRVWKSGAENPGCRERGVTLRAGWRGVNKFRGGLRVAHSSS